MTKLDQELESLERVFIRPKTVSFNEILMQKLGVALAKIKRAEGELRTAKQELGALNQKASMIMALLGSGELTGFLVVSQADNFGIESGFTSLQDIAHHFDSMWFKLFLGREEPKLHLGDELYHVANNGMLTFIKAKRDSSD